MAGVPGHRAEGGSPSPGAHGEVPASSKGVGQRAPNGQAVWPSHRPWGLIPPGDGPSSVAQIL